MSDSEKLDHLANKHSQIKQSRLDAVRRWVDYIKENPPEVWGPQQNAIVNSQIESAQQVGYSAVHEHRVQEIAQQLAVEQSNKDETDSD